MEKWHAANPELGEEFTRKYEKGQFRSPEVSPNPSPHVGARSLGVAADEAGQETTTLEQRLAALDTEGPAAVHPHRRGSADPQMQSTLDALESPNSHGRHRRASAPGRFDQITQKDRVRRTSKFDVYVMPDVMGSIEHPKFDADVQATVVAAVEAQLHVADT